MRHRIAGVVLVGWFLAGCSSPSGQANSAPQIGPGSEVASTEAALTAEQIEEVERTVKLGQDAINGCYEQEMERLKDKKLAGRVTLQIHISTDRVADQVIVGEHTLTGAPLHDCMIKTVKSWEFPRLNAPVWRTYPYEFTPAY